MEKEQSELIDHIINPDFLENIKQSKESIAIQSWISFDMERNGTEYYVTIYTGKDGQVNISSKSEGGYSIGQTILSDYCQTIEDFKGTLDKLDDMETRRPKSKE